jgi:transposase
VWKAWDGTTRTLPGELTDKEWNILEKLLAPGSEQRRPRYSKRAIINAMLYLVWEGCTWRGLSRDFAPCRIVFHYFAKWQEEGVWKGSIMRYAMGCGWPVASPGTV